MKSNVEQTLKNFSKEDVERAIDQSITMWQWVAEYCMKYGDYTKVKYFQQYENLAKRIPMNECYLCEMIRNQYFRVGYLRCAEICPVKWAPPNSEWHMNPCDLSTVSPYYQYVHQIGEAKKVAALQVVALLQDVKNDLKELTEEKENDA